MRAQNVERRETKEEREKRRAVKTATIEAHRSKVKAHLSRQSAVQKLRGSTTFHCPLKFDNTCVLPNPCADVCALLGCCWWCVVGVVAWWRGGVVAWWRGGSGVKVGAWLGHRPVGPLHMHFLSANCASLCGWRGMAHHCAAVRLVPPRDPGLPGS